MNSNRLLVVDDEPDVSEFVGAVAEEAGFKVSIAHNAEDFRSGYRSFDPSVIILDLIMPDADGIEHLRYLAENGCHSSILILSGADTRVIAAAQRLAAGLGLSIMGVLQKPATVFDLEAMLRKVTVQDRMITVGDIREALETDQLVLHYQPKVVVHAQNRWSVGTVEALVRWQHPGLGMVMPDEFVPVAERSDLIAPLTFKVIDLAMEQLKLWDATASSISLAINLSAQLLDELKLPDQLCERLAQHGVDASRLVLEITESAAMADETHAMDVLTRFRLKGFGLSIDDFGTGYSSLVKLYRMPFSELKVDRSFVMELGRSDEAMTIVRAIVNLAHNLGLRVCAEGVETLDAVDFLRELGCDEMQGYYFSKPVPGEQLAPLLREWERKGRLGHVLRELACRVSSIC